MSTVIPLDVDSRRDLRARVKITDTIRETLGDDAAEAMITLLSAVSVACDAGDQHKPEHLLALISSTYPAFVAAVTR